MKRVEFTQAVKKDWESKAEKAISKARVRMITRKNLVFFGTLAMKMKLVSDWSIPTLMTDGIKIWYNPFYLLSLPADVQVAALTHEILHCAFCTPLRRGTREPMKWNMATDYVINLCLREAELKVHQGWLLNDKYIGMTSEQVYDLLPDPPSGGGKGDKQDGGGKGQGDGQGGGTPFENPENGCGGVKDPTDENGQPLSPSEMAQQEMQMRNTLAEAMNTAKLAGTMPGNMERLVDKLLNPQVPYKELLRQFLDRVVRDDYSWQKPNKRYIHQNVYLPVLQTQDIGEVVVVVDTSGSMGQKELDVCAAEVSGVLESGIVSKVHVLYVDTEVAGHEEYGKHDTPIKLTPRGGGGTDFRPPFEWCEKNEVIPTVLLYITDMCCNSFPEAPSYPALWVKIGRWDNPPPPFGEVVATLET